LGWKDPERKDGMVTPEELLEVYKGYIADYPVISIEDGFDQNDWAGWARATTAIGKDTQIVGDDLLVTNPQRIKQAVEAKACNALLLKVNQIGTVTESIDAVKLAKQVCYLIFPFACYPFGHLI
jgi:enolase